jgi:hypothetical protein
VKVWVPAGAVGGTLGRWALRMGSLNRNTNGRASVPTTCLRALVPPGVLEAEQSFANGGSSRAIIFKTTHLKHSARLLRSLTSFGPAGNRCTHSDQVLAVTTASPFPFSVTVSTSMLSTSFSTNSLFRS